MSHATHVFTSTHAFFCYSEGDLAEKVAGIQAVDFAPCVKHLKLAEEKNLKKSEKIVESRRDTGDRFRSLRKAPGIGAEKNRKQHLIPSSYTNIHIH